MFLQVYIYLLVLGYLGNGNKKTVSKCKRHQLIVVITWHSTRGHLTIYSTYLVFRNFTNTAILNARPFATKLAISFCRWDSTKTLISFQKHMLLFSSKSMKLRNKKCKWNGRSQIDYRHCTFSPTIISIWSISGKGQNCHPVFR